MSYEKKFTAKQVAEAVLQKAAEMIEQSDLAKKEHKHIGWGKLHGKLEREGYSEESADKIAGAIKAKVEKSEEPKGEIHPKEHVEGEPDAPGARIHSQQDPELNPKEEAEGNNKEWGTAPETYGTLKLAKFLGHMDHKRKSKKAQELPVQDPNAENKKV